LLVGYGSGWKKMDGAKQEEKYEKEGMNVGWGY